MTMNIGVNVNADVSKLQALDRQMKQVKSTYDQLAKSAKQAGSAFSGGLPGGAGAHMPMAGSVVPPSGFALMSKMNPHMGMAGSRMSPLMYGPAFNAQMHQLMPGQIPHQYGAQSALTQLSNQHKAMAGHSSTYNAGGLGVSNELKQLTTALTNLTKALKQPASSTSSSISNPASNMNPWLSLQSQSAVLNAMNPSATPSGIASVNYSTLPTSTQNRMAAAQQRLANPIQPAKSSVLQKVAQIGTRMIGTPYQAEMAGGAAAEGLGMAGSLAGIGVSAGIGAGVAALMWGGKKVSQGYQVYQETANPINNLYHSIMPGSSFSSFYNSIIGQGNSVGASNQMKAQVAQILASTGGPSALNSVGSVLQGAVGLGYGVNNASALASQVAELQRLGLTSGLSSTSSNSQLMMMLGNATVSGGMQGRTSDLINAMTSLTQSLDQQRTTPANTSALLSMMTTLSKPINGQSLQSLQGQRGANILSNVNNSLSSPGGGTAGQMLMYQWLTNGTNMSPYQYQYLTEQGLTGKYGGKGPTNLQRIVQGAMTSFPQLAKGLTATGAPTASQAMALEQLAPVLGLSGHQTQAFLSQFTKNGKFSMTNLNNEQNWWTSKVGGTPNASWAVAGAQLYNANNYSSVNSIAKMLQSNGIGMSSTEKSQLAQLQKAGNGPLSSSQQNTLNALKTEMGKQMLQSPMLTSQDQLTKAISDNNNAWSKFGPVLTSISKSLNTIASVIPGGAGSSSTSKSKFTPSITEKYGTGFASTAYNYTGYSPMNSQVANMGMMVALNNAYNSNASSMANNVQSNMSYNGNYGSSPGTSAPGISQWSNYINQAAAKYGIPANMIAAVMKEESGGTNGLTSSAGAMGLMQLMPGTAKGLGVTNPWNAQDNIMGGAKLLSQLLQQFHGNWNQALQAYNGGPGGVGGSAEQQYASQVEAFYQAFQKSTPIQVHVHVGTNGSSSSGLDQYYNSQL